jgi:hypothetical protein
MPIRELADDYSPGHPPGRGGNWEWMAWERLIQQAVEAGRRIKPDIAFATEGINELAIPYITFYNDRDLMAEAITAYSKLGVPVPAFSFVYKPYAQAQTEYYGTASASAPASFHLLALSRAFLWGQRAQLPTNPWLSDPAYSSSVLAYYVATEKWRSQFSRFMVDGVMQRSADVVSPSTPIQLVGEGALSNLTTTASSVQTATWRAPNGEIGIFLTNISLVTVSVAVPVDFSRLNLALGRDHEVTVHSLQSARPQPVIRGNSAVNVTLAPSEILAVIITPPTSVPARLINLSVRSTAGTGDQSLIVGFAISGNGTESVLVRAIGPTLSDFGVGSALTDPVLEISRLGGAPLLINDDWSGAAELKAAFGRVGAFALSADSSRDAAALLDVSAGAYTNTINTKGGSGVALVEVYDAGATGDAQLSNLSARTRAGVGDQALIAGFVISGTERKRLLVRAVGPTLQAFGVEGALTDPVLEIKRLGSDEVVAANDDWDGAAYLRETFAAVGAFSFSSDNSRDAAVVVELPAGTYTATVSGRGGVSGTALVEVYQVPDR